MDRLVEVVRIYDRDGKVGVETMVLFQDLRPGYSVIISDPRAAIAMGWAILYKDRGKLHGRFQKSIERVPSVVNGLRMQGPAFRIRLEDNEIGETPGSRLGLQPMFFQAFRALNRFLDIYRVSKYQMNPHLTAEEGPGPWAWLDPGRPDTFTEFLSRSYAVLDLQGSRSVEAGLMPKSFRWRREDSAILRRGIRRDLRRDVPLGRLLMLDAWTALYAGSIRSAITLANTALEVEIRRILIRKLEPVYGEDAKKRIDDLLQDTSFPKQLQILLPLAGVRLPLEKSKLQDVRRLREARTQVVHKGREGADWDRAKQLLMSAEAVFRGLDRTGKRKT